MTKAKRAVDLVIATAGIVAISPLLAVIAIAVRLDGGPVFFRQERIGRQGRPFRIWKFRTMVPNADRLGPQLTVQADPRITKVGALLRRWKFDELPQLFNVLAGDMTLVGPRPEVARYVSRYTTEQREILDFTPGITAPASIAFYDEASVLADAGDDYDRVYVEKILPIKISVDLEYSRDATVVTDAKVMLRTLGVLGAAPRDSDHVARAYRADPR